MVLQFLKREEVIKTVAEWGKAHIDDSMIADSDVVAELIDALKELETYGGRDGEEERNYM